MACDAAPGVRLVRIDGLNLPEELPDELLPDEPAASYLLTWFRTGRAAGAADGGGYRPMHRATTRKVVGRRSFDRVWPWLLAEGIVEEYSGTGPRFRPGRQSTRYRIAEPYRSRAYRFETRDDPALTARIAAARRELTFAVHVWMADQFRHVRAAPGWESALPNHPGAASAARDCLERLDSGGGARHCSVDDFGARFYSPLTNLQSSMRKWVRLCGEPLVELDIRNSQPLFLCLDLLAWHSAGGTWAPVTDAADGSGPYAGDPVLSMIGRATPDGRALPPAKRDGVPDDVLRFVESCEAGTIYDLMADRIGCDRDAAKQGFLRALYCERGHERRGVRDFLSDHHPGVLDHLERAKRTKGGRFLALRLQRTEAAFVMAGCVAELMRENPARPALTLHDALYCRRSDGADVAGAMRDTFARCGLHPVLAAEAV